MKKSKKRGNTSLLASDLTSLPGLDRTSLLDRWRELYSAEPPVCISRSLLIRSIAYCMQEQVMGGLKPAARRFLEKAAEDATVGRKIAVPPSVIKAGTRLLREWHGITYEVVVLENGVQFQGKQYRSLSEVAHAITGVHWSGPRFFGLKRQAV